MFFNKKLSLTGTVTVDKEERARLEDLLDEESAGTSKVAPKKRNAAKK